MTGSGRSSTHVRHDGRSVRILIMTVPPTDSLTGVPPSRAQEIEQRRLAHHRLRTVVAAGERSFLVGGETRAHIGAEMAGALDDAMAGADARSLKGPRRALHVRLP